MQVKVVYAGISFVSLICPFGLILPQSHEVKVDDK